MTDVNDIKKITKADNANMLQILLDLPVQCQQAIEIAGRFKAPHNYRQASFNKILFTGIGGSAIGADIVKTFVSAEIKIPILVNRNYDIPAYVDDETLVFACSYSGDTEETLSAYSQIKEKGAKIIAITSGGKLHDLALKDDFPFILIPKGIPPRTAVGFMSIIPLLVLSDLKLIKSQDESLKETTKVLKGLKTNVLSPEIPVSKNIAKEVASKIFNRFVIIYGAEDFLGAVVTRWRQELEENSKIVCSSAVLPEMNHNEITGWEDPMHICKDAAVIFLRDKDEHPRTSRRIEVTEELIAKRTSHVIEVESIGKSLLARTFSLIYIGTFVSFYLAILNGIDPSPVNNVTYLKKQLAKNN